MSLKKYDSLPEFMKNPEVKEYYEILSERKGQLTLKRFFDIIGGTIGTIVLLPIMAVLAIIIKLESKGPALFKQVRVTQYGREFKILKFRTMVVNAEKLGTQVTSKNDPRVTKVGKFLRKYRLDELPQIINILKGDLSFVGTRPEVPKFVKEYTNDMIATLLLPAGVTSEASIEFKDEEKILDNSSNVDNDYIYKVLPLKMKYNLNYIKHFTVLYDFKIMLRTVGAVLGLGEKDE
ncbi:sugar transferase [Clostridium sp. NSJ-6]|uniref:Sugar transferase n=1 Tax=Clostridium hominis TaxID=2763036 RepID=A0ABR7DBI5_9CLOT|nr:sugar transferase [Clostridium hominis]MBC5628058.1 sugar transferase [Clostridium hominis]MDU2673179.1 sugar transferase [Clostridium sp.]